MKKSNLRTALSQLEGGLAILQGLFIDPECEPHVIGDARRSVFDRVKDLQNCVQDHEDTKREQAAVLKRLMNIRRRIAWFEYGILGDDPGRVVNTMIADFVLGKAELEALLEVRW